MQTTSGPDRDHNLAQAGELVAEAARAGSRLVVLPEMVNRLGSGAVLRSGAEPFDGPTLAWAREQAHRHGIWLHAGTFIEALDPTAPDRRSNTAVLLSPDGTVLGSYRKVHLFDCDVPGAEFRESDVTEPGDRLALVALPDLHPAAVVGFSICYDLRFPEVFRALAVAGATILTVPAAFTARTGPPHWEVLLRARAIEDQCFVIAAGQHGTTAPGLSWHGHSMIIDPWGEVLAEATAPGPGVVTADLDFGRLAEVRAVLPSLARRRPAAYEVRADS